MTGTLTIAGLAAELLISAFTVTLGPLSGVRTTSMGTAALKFRACTVMVRFGSAPKGRFTVTGESVPSAIAVPAASTISSRGLLGGNTVMKLPTLNASGRLGGVKRRGTRDLSIVSMRIRPEAPRLA